MSGVGSTEPPRSGGAGFDGAGAGMSAQATPLLEAVQVRKEFGGLVAVNDVDFTIPHGSIVSLIGPNGAGKTTFFNMLTGVYKPTAGLVLFDGKEIQGLPPHKVTQLGMARTFQNIRLFHSMTALENVLVAMHSRIKGGIWASIVRTPRLKAEEAEAERRGRELLRFSGLRGKRARVREEPPLRRPAAARGRARARHRAEAAAARRADRGDESRGDGGLHRLRRDPAPRARHHRAADRARHERRDGRLRPRHRARLRREDRRGRAAGGAERPARDRGLPRDGAATA